MLQELRNERGGALIIVLFILILFTVLGFAIASYTMQSATQHTFSEDEVQGKMLADMGLAYFQEYLEHTLSITDSTINSAIATPSDTDGIVNLLNNVASKMTSSNGPFRRTLLPPLSPGGERQGFAIGYQIEQTIPYRTETSDPAKPNSQPYVRKLKVSVIGLPVRGSQDVGMIPRRVRLDAIVYINTIPAPFHYAVSTPGELRLFGGSNIIGNITAHNIVTSKEYRYSEEEGGTAVWKADTASYNQPYLEGTISLSARESGGTLTPGTVYRLDQVPRKDSGEIEAPTTGSVLPASLESDHIISSRQSLKDEFTPRDLSEADKDKNVLSAPFDTPYLPGFEAPVLEQSTGTARPLFLHDDVGSFVRGKISAAGNAASEFTVNQSESIYFEKYPPSEDELNQGFRLVNAPSSDKLVIQQDYAGVDLDTMTAVPLTVRLTGDKYNSLHQMFIGVTGSSDNRAISTVEMGRLGSFNPDTTKRNGGDPFTFTGTIYIKGNLDIVGDIKVNGTIYVDGDVLIREISNLDKQNLAIIASGTISLTSRYMEETDLSKHSLDGWKSIPPLSAFLYSEKSMEIFSAFSYNRIEGGIATGNGSTGTANPDSYIEFDTKREAESNNLASRLTIQFNRKIFEAETPGLPPGEEFFLDLYDLSYHPNPDDVTIVN